MTRNHWILVVLLAFLATPVAAEIYECLEPSGNKVFTSDPKEAKAKGCYAINIGSPTTLLLGAGGSGCGEWVSSRAKGTAGTMAAINMEGWVLGFLSGAALVSNRDVLRNVDAESIFLWMDNYCKANPLERVHVGSGRLFSELVKKLPQRGRNP